MRTFAKPRVVVSKCLEFAPCRYDGAMISNEFVRRLKHHVEFLPVCPEMEIGLGCPRQPIRVIQTAGQRRLVQPATGHDLTNAMDTFASAFLGTLEGVEGFLLKNRSPSCGIKDVKVYARPDAETPLAKAAGLFGAAVMERFPGAATEDEGRLTNSRLREHWLTNLFLLAEFRAVRARGRMADMVDFHARSKSILMAYHQTVLRRLGRIVANPRRQPMESVLADYAAMLPLALARPPRPSAIVNVLMHCLGQVSDGLSHDEKAMFLDALEKYRARRLPLSALLAMIKAWAVRFGHEGLIGQSLLEPYPEALVAETLE